MFQNINENTIDLDSKNENKKSTNKLNIFSNVFTKRQYRTLHSFIYAIFCWTKW